MTEYLALVAARQMAAKEWKEQRITARIAEVRIRDEARKTSTAGQRTGGET